MALGYFLFENDTNTRNANSIYGESGRGLGLGGDDPRAPSPTSRSPSSPPLAGATAPPTRAFMRRSGNWRRLLDLARMVEWRFADGRFPVPYDNLGGGGFVEGNSVQYTWMVPH